MTDSRLPELPPRFLDRVRAMPKVYDQFLELADRLIDRNPKLRADDAYNTAQRTFGAITKLDLQIQNGGIIQFFWNKPQWVEFVEPALRAIGATELEKAFYKALEQLSGNLDSFIKARESDTLDAFVEVANENDFEWFEELYFGEYDKATGKWSGLVEDMYARSVGYVLENLGEFVVT